MYSTHRPSMKNKKTFLVLFLFLHLAFASKVKKHGSKGPRHGGVRPLGPGKGVKPLAPGIGKGVAGYLLKTKNGKTYLRRGREGRNLRTSPANLVIY